jgi:class 3 adenylate cyclase
MQCPACGAENPEGAKFCLECGKRLPIVCPNCQARNLPTAKFCNQCGTPLGAASEQPQPSSPPANQPPPTTTGQPPRPGLTPASALSEPFASSESGGGQGEAEDMLILPQDSEERRVVTILFADMTGSTALAESMDPEEVRLLLAGYFSTMAQAIHRHGGTIEKFIGDAVMAVFGAPTAHEDDPDRAVRAALEMMEELHHFNERRQADDPQAVPIQIRIGINTGDVVAASSAHEGGQFFITGDAVNVAARLQQYAQPGTILVGERTYRSTQGAIVYEALSPIEVKGKSEALHVWRAITTVDDQAAPATQRSRGINELPSPFIGRAPEMAIMDALYERVIEEHRPHLVTLMGAPGVGKSRLVREWLRRALHGENAITNNEPTTETGPIHQYPEPLVLEGRCPPYGAGITYWPLAEILRSYCGFTESDSAQAARDRLTHMMQELLHETGQADDSSQLVRQLSFAIGLEVAENSPRPPAGDSKEHREALFRAWRIFFESLARRQPLLTFIDDIHWADEALLDLLEYLAQRVSAAPLFIICPTRPDLLDKRPGWGGGKRNFTTLTLEPLSPEQSHQMLDAMIPPQALPISLRSSILSKAEGNPYFVEEILRMLIDRGILVCNDDDWQVTPQDPDATFSVVLSAAIPDTIQGVLAARIDFLSQQEKRLLQHAAVAGRTFWKGALASLAQEMKPDALNQALEGLRRKEFLQENERPTGMILERDVQYSFKHVLVRDVAYASIPRARRAREHARMAEWLERVAAGRIEEFIELLAYHYHQAVITWSQTTSGQALARRPSRAQAQADLRQKAILYLIQAGDEAVGKYAANQAVRQYTAAMNLLNGTESDRKLRPDVHKKLGRAYFVLSDGDASWDHYQHALAESQEATPAERAHLYQHLTMLSTRWRGMFKQPPDFPLIRTLLHEGLELLKDQPESNDLALLLASEAFWYIQAYFNHQADETALEHAIASAERATSIAEKLNHPAYYSEVLDALSSVYANISDYRAFLEVQKRRLTLVDRIRDKAEILDVYYTASNGYYFLAEYAQALIWANEAVKVAESINSRRKLCAILAHKVTIYFAWDRWSEVLLWGEKLAALCEQYDLLHQSWPAPYGIRALAMVYYYIGQEERGNHYAQMLEQAIGRIEQNVKSEILIAQLRIAQQRLEEARELLQRVVTQFPGIESIQVQAFLAEVCVRLGNEAAYDALPPSLLAQLERSGDRKSWAMLLRTRGIVRSRHGDASGANEDLRIALATYREIGTRWEEALTLEALAVHLKQTHAGDGGDEAATLLEASQEIYEELHAEPALIRIRNEMRLNGAKVHHDVR